MSNRKTLFSTCLTVGPIQLFISFTKELHAIPNYVRCKLYLFPMQCFGQVRVFCNINLFVYYSKAVQARQVHALNLLGSRVSLLLIIFLHQIKMFQISVHVCTSFDSTHLNFIEIESFYISFLVVFESIILNNFP